MITQQLLSSIYSIANTSPPATAPAPHLAVPKTAPALVVEVAAGAPVLDACDDDAAAEDEDDGVVLELVFTTTIPNWGSLGCV